jgi:Cu(I)/Ag(I) efflux system periplasmic protein CusF
MMRFWTSLLLLSATVALAQPSQSFGPNEGEVLDIDRKAQEITIRHGHIPELSMDPMSMVFNVADPALLNRVRKGDRVRFKADLVAGRFAIVSITRIAHKRKETP